MSTKAQPERAERAERAEDAQAKPELSTVEDEALRLLRELARSEPNRPAISHRPDRRNRYALP
jgi:hypothetical protein